MVRIIQKENKVLRQTAKEVSKSEIGTFKLKKIISDMKKALKTQGDGVALAAPQIGISKRIFVVSGKVSAYTKGEDVTKHNYPDSVFINPKIIKLSKEKSEMEEGCLSVRYLYGKVKRSVKAVVTYTDESGKQHQKGASGLLAQIFQHETDHLNGVLFTDKAKDLKEIPPELLNKK